MKRVRHERFTLRLYLSSDHGPTLPRCKSCRGKFLYSIKYIHCISLRMSYSGDQTEYVRLIGTLEIRAIHQEIGHLTARSVPGLTDACFLPLSRRQGWCTPLQHHTSVGVNIKGGQWKCFSKVLCYLLGCN